MPKKFYSIKAQANGTADIYIYEQIGEDWWSGGGVVAKNFVKDLMALDVDQINLHVNSPGGDVFDGNSIYNALRMHPANVTTYIDGLAASISSVIALAGNKVIMAKNALFMIHNPVTMAAGDADAMRKTADLLDVVKNTIVSTYMTKAVIPESDVRAKMDAESWLSADEAKEMGFCDEISDEVDMAACAGFDLSKFKKAPRSFVKTEPAKATPVKNDAQPDCFDSDTEPEIPCGDCEFQDECTNPNNDSVEGSTGNEAPVKATIKEEKKMPDVKVEAKAGAENAAAIVEMATTHGFQDKAAEWIKSGKTANEVGLEILDLMVAGQAKGIVPAAKAPAIVDMTKKDARAYSYAKAIRAGAQMRDANLGTPDGLEVEIHNEILKKLPSNYAAHGGILVPLRVQDAAPTPLTTGGVNTGAETVFQEYGEFIDILRNLMVCTRMGARVLTGLQGPVNFPKQTGASTVTWLGENPGADAAGSNITFGTVSISPKTAMGVGALSRQLIIQSTPDVEGLVRDDLAAVHGLEGDRVGLHGTGANNEPTGVYNASGVNAIAMGGMPTYSKLVAMATAMAKKNALLGNLGFATTPEMAGLLMTTLKFAVNGSSEIWQGNHVDGTVAGYKAMSSNQVSSTLGAGAEHGLMFGNWNDMIIGMWGALEILVDPFTLAAQGLLRIITYQMMDIAVRRGESFTKATGATII